MFFGGGPGIRLMRFRGVDVQLDFSVIIMMALFILPQVSQFPRQYPQWSTTEVWSAAILIGVLFIGSILVHELSHAWVGMMLGAEVSGIRLYIFGGATFFSRKPVSEGRNFWISIVGPLSNLALWKLFDLGLQSSISGGASVWSVVCFYLSTANFFLAVFNALPGYPMDGGQALRSGLFWLTKNELLAARVVMVLGCLTGGLIGLWALDSLRGQDTIGLLFRGLIAYWIITGSIAQYRSVERVGPIMPRPRAGESAPTAVLEPAPTGVLVGQVMSQPSYYYPPETTVEQFLGQTTNLDDKAWVPVLREGYLSGIVNRQAARKTPKEELASRKLEQVMLPRRSLPVVSVDDDLSKAGEVVQASRGQPVPVLGPGGLFAGFLSRENLKG